MTLYSVCDLLVFQQCRAPFCSQPLVEPSDKLLRLLVHLLPVVLVILRRVVAPHYDRLAVADEIDCIQGIGALGMAARGMRSRRRICRRDLGGDDLNGGLSILRYDYKSCFGFLLNKS
ncbi:hypothetical protein EJ110_NYTH42079 [Nymphaea thermarum]|nr:hypothetical protein EJ110_NYTH42079 [Nymphaea thermarum]